MAFHGGRYVEQEDTLYAELSVEETILFNAKMKLKKNDVERQRAVNRIIDQFGLYDVRHSHIGDAETRGISGGERKRVSIAEQLVSDPRVVFLDEPTSGLDAFTAMSLCESIKRYASEDQKTVLLTIHQPRLNTLKKFNKILLLAEGYVVFFGSVDEAIEHFARLGYPCPNMENPADYFIDLLTVNRESAEQQTISKARIKSLIAARQTSTIPSVEVPIYNPKSKYVRGHAVQFGLLLQRNFRITFRDWQQLLTETIAIMFVGVLISFVFFQLPLTFVGARSRIGLLFFIVVNMMFVIVNNLEAIFALDRQIIIKERYGNTYRLTMAYLARFLSLLPIKLVVFTVYAFMIYYITGLSRGYGFDNFIVFWAILMALVFAALSLGFAIASFATTVKQAQIIGTIVIVIFLLFGGNLAVAGGVTWILRWIQYTSPIFYAYDGLSQNSLNGIQFNNTNPVSGPIGLLNGKSYLKQISLAQLPVVADGLAVLGLGIVYFVLGYFLLYWRTMPHMIIKTKQPPPPPLIAANSSSEPNLTGKPTDNNQAHGLPEGLI